MVIEPMFPPTNEHGVYVPPSTPEPMPMPDDKAMEYLLPWRTMRGKQAVIWNGLTRELIQQYGYLPLSVRGAAAEAAMKVVEDWQADDNDDDDVWLEGMLRTGHAGEV